LYAQRAVQVRSVARECRHLMFRLGRQGYFEHLRIGVH
jgi:hypothetical protein